MKLYSVVNMDIVGSRNVKDRNLLQCNLGSYINQINQKYRHILSAPITITLGDEWQLITDKLSESYNLVHEFQQLLWKDKVELYAGIGIGELRTPISEDIRKMDGPCFHIARDAFNIAKNVDKLKNKYTINKLNKIFLLTSPISEDRPEFNILDLYYSTNTKYMETIRQEIAAVTEPNTRTDQVLDRLLLERTINLIIENTEILKARMTDKQKDIYVSYTELKSYRKVVGATEGSSKETIGGISQKLNSASYFTIQRNHYMVSALLDAFYRMKE